MRAKLSLLVVYLFLFSFLTTAFTSFPSSTNLIQQLEDTGWMEQCISNCGFESNNMSGWTQSGGTFDVNGVFVHSGNYAVNGTSATQAYFYRKLSVSQYSTWINAGYGTSNFGAWLDPGHSEYGKLVIKFLGTSDNDLGNSYSSGWVRTEEDDHYDFFGGARSIPPGTVNILIEVHAQRTALSYTDMNADDITVKIRFIVPNNNKIFMPLVHKALPGGNVTGHVVSATSGLPLNGATVCALSINQCTTTDDQGHYTLSNLPIGSQNIWASFTGYTSQTQTVIIPSGETVELDFVLSPILAPGEIRIILTWGQNPRDLDSHLWLPPTNPYHIYYARMGSPSTFPYAWLDIDDVTSFGPETTTIHSRYPGAYVFAVYLFAGEGTLSTSGAKVRFYNESGLVAEYSVPVTGTGRWWYVFDFDGVSGAITPRNYITTVCPGPYDCTGTLSEELSK